MAWDFTRKVLLAAHLSALQQQLCVRHTRHVFQRGVAHTAAAVVTCPLLRLVACDRWSDDPSLRFAIEGCRKVALRALLRLGRLGLGILESTACILQQCERGMHRQTKGMLCMNSVSAMADLTLWLQWTQCAGRLCLGIVESSA